MQYDSSKPSQSISTELCDIRDCLNATTEAPISEDDLRVFLILHGRLSSALRSQSLLRTGAADLLSIPSEVFNMIALLAKDDNPRNVAALAGVCHQTHSAVIDSSNLFSNVADLPTNPSLFMHTLLRVLQQRCTLILDLPRFTAKRILPDAALMLSAIRHCSSINITHHVGLADLLVEMRAIGTLPELTVLKYIPLLGLFRLGADSPRALHHRLKGHVPSVDAPQLQTLWLQHAYLEVLYTNTLADLRIDCVSRISRSPSFHPWPTSTLFRLLARATQLTHLHLLEAIDYGSEPEAVGPVNLPVLQHFVIAMANTRAIAWLLNHVAFPAFTSLAVRVGHPWYNHHVSLRTLFRALAPLYRRTTFSDITIIHSPLQSAVCLGSGERQFIAHDPHAPVLHPFVTPESPGAYAPQPGAIDVSFRWPATNMPSVKWVRYLPTILSYVDASALDSCEISGDCHDFGYAERIVLRSMPGLRSLRLWPEQFIGLDVIVRKLCGDDPDFFARDFRDVVGNVCRLCDVPQGQVYTGDTCEDMVALLSNITVCSGVY